MTALNSGLLRIAAAILFACTCGCYQTQYVYRQVERQVERQVVEPQKHTPQRLTLDMIREFKISERKLWRLRYYIENTLILQRVTHSGSSFVTLNRELDLKRTINQDEIVFEHMASGFAFAIRQEWRFKNLKLVDVIWVQFENHKNYSLMFAPNFCGEYVLEKVCWTNAVNYGGRSYQSLLVNVNNFLLVDTHLLEDVNHSRRIVAGIKSGQ